MGAVGPSPRRRGRSARPGALLWALAVVFSSGCVCPAPAEEVARAHDGTPEAALRAYQAYLASDLTDLEYRLLSQGFRRRHELSALTYGEGRERLFQRKPWLRLFAKAKVVHSEGVGEGLHRIDVRVGGRTVRVNLVREDFFEIRSGDEVLAFGDVSFEDATEVRYTQGLPRFVATVPIEEGAADLSRASSFSLAGHWRIDDLQELEGEADPVPIQP